MKLRIYSWARTGALVVCAVVVASLLTEGVLRIATPPTIGEKPFPNSNVVRVDPILGWINAPLIVNLYAVDWQSHYVGGENLPPIPSDPSEETRIVCLGDSGTFGFWKSWDQPQKAMRMQRDNYPEQLARYLHAEFSDEIRVYNGGVLGYTTSHGLRQLYAQVLELRPDIVTVRFGFNDHIPAWGPERRVTEPRNVFLREALYSSLDWRLTRVVLNGLASVTALHPPSHSVPWVTREQFARNLQRFAEIGRQNGFHVLFIDYPLGPPESLDPVEVQPLLDVTGDESLAPLIARHRAYQKILRDVSLEEGVPLLETSPIFADESAALFSRADIVHPNDGGAQRLAVLLADRFVELGWLD